MKMFTVKLLLFLLLISFESQHFVITGLQSSSSPQSSDTLDINIILDEKAYPEGLTEEKGGDYSLNVASFSSENKVFDDYYDGYPGVNAITDNWIDTTKNGEVGPERWHPHEPTPSPPHPFNLCKTGHFQSPLNIPTSSTVPSRAGPMRTINYSVAYRANLVVTNSTVNIFLKEEEGKQLPRIFGGNLPRGNVFEFHSLHWHWGSNDARGSEHRLDGFQFSAELHIVHRNLKYPNADVASNQPDGISVVAFLLEVKRTWFQSDAWYYPVVEAIRKYNQGRPLAPVDIGYISLTSLTSLMTSGDHFYYKGSLTTPPCTENVFWHVFIQPVYISELQINAYRHLRNRRGELLSDNFREVQQRNGREILLYREEENYEWI